MDRKKRRKTAAPAPAVDGGVRFDGMSTKQLVRLWEDVIDRDVVAARKVFFRALLRDAAAEYKQEAAPAAAARRAAGDEGEEEGQDRGYQHERFLFRPCSTPWEASPPPPPPEPTVVLCLRAAPTPPRAPHLAVGELKRQALSRDATAEHKQEEVALHAAAAGVGGGGEDRGHPPHNAPTAVLCLPTRHRRLAAAGLELEDDDDDDEDHGHPPHERLVLEPCSTPRDEASPPPPEPTPIARMAVLCLRAPAPVQTSRRRGVSDHAR